ncbi:hypothetical protein [Sphingobacterium puteale]|nr:hypothetical protein [Sphingobacterium puteale]
MGNDTEEYNTKHLLQNHYDLTASHSERGHGTGKGRKRTGG